MGAAAPRHRPGKARRRDRDGVAASLAEVMAIHHAIEVVRTHVGVDRPSAADQPQAQRHRPGRTSEHERSVVAQAVEERGVCAVRRGPSPIGEARPDTREPVDLEVVSQPPPGSPVEPGHLVTIREEQQRPRVGRREPSAGSPPDVSPGLDGPVRDHPDRSGLHGLELAGRDELAHLVRADAEQLRGLCDRQVP
jgi:hypothetical protein